MQIFSFFIWILCTYHPRKIGMLLILTALVFNACQQKQVVTVGNQPVVYRSSFDPLPVLQPGQDNAQLIAEQEDASANPNAFAACYVQWQVEHERLVDAVEQEHGKLAILEAHRRVVACLEKMARYAASRQPWDEYQQQYHNLLQETNQRVPVRILVNEYYQLRQTIQHDLFQ